MTLEFEFQREYFVEAIKVVLRKRRFGFLYQPAFLTLFGALSVLVLALELADGDVSVPALILPLYAVLLPLWPHWAAKASLKANEHQGRLRLTADDQGLQLEGAHARTQTGWGNYGSYVETPRAFVLRSPDRGGRCAMVLAKRGAGHPADVDLLRAILDRHLTRV
ncbi:hypothetical protein SRB5_03510 [Streptomyces sp. RB5]|uniref:YcxB-like protein domain-containing protein n=1 Tax=Streptomyces smaragdinus TaxID=2585196 RepID=A0A7K0CBU7_9ACTN|nr:hypothetical protein [Streptomyces smaragdinus]MQY10244.1 hypothetical protein [Streptomyces smaragdinus]